MRKTHLTKTLSKTIIVATAVLVVGTIAITYVITKCDIIRRKKEQTTSLVYYIEYNT